MTLLGVASSLTAMNMFRNLLVLFLLAFGFSLIFSNPSDWTFIERGGPNVISFFKICETFRPFVCGACFVTAVALILTRKIY